MRRLSVSMPGLLFSLALAVLLPACGGREAPRSAVAAPAPVFSLPDLSGKKVSLEDYRGKVVLVDFWATWCPPCRESIPALKAFQEEYGPRGVQVLGISLDEDSSSPAGFARDQGINYPVLLAKDTDVAGRYGVRGIPSMFLVNREGAVVARWIGFDGSYAREWRAAADRALSAS